MKKIPHFLKFKKLGIVSSVCIIAASAGVLGNASSSSEQAMQKEAIEAIENDRSDLAVPEFYTPAADELATDREFIDALKDQNVVAGEEEEAASAEALPSDEKSKTPVQKKKRHVTLAKPSGETFHFTPEGGMKSPDLNCSLYMNESGEYNAYGRIIKDYIHEEVKKNGSSRFLSNDLVGMDVNPKVCPNWKSLNDETKVKFWVWAFAATAFEESRCNAKVPDHYDINDYAVGLYQLERTVKVRGRRGPSCMVSAKEIHTPYSNIRCAMDIIRYQLLPISTKEFQQTGRLYSAAGQRTNSYFYWLRQANGGEIGKHIRNFTPCTEIRDNGAKPPFAIPGSDSATPWNSPWSQPSPYPGPFLTP